MRLTNSLNPLSILIGSEIRYRITAAFIYRVTHQFDIMSFHDKTADCLTRISLGIAHIDDIIDGENRNRLFNV